jgi:hypothetical protein
MRRGLFLASLPVAVAVLLIAVVSPASAARHDGNGHSPPRMVTHAYMVYGAKNFERDGSLATDLRKPGAVDRLAAKAARSGTGVRKTEYGMSSSALAAPPDDITPEECRDRSELSGRAEGWIKNHYSYCQLSAVVAVEERCWWRFCNTVGFFSARVTLMGFAYNGLRNADWTVYLDEVSAFGSANGGRFTYEIDCAGTPDDDSCLPASHDVTKSVQAWRRDGKGDLLFFSPAEPSSPEWGQQIDTGIFKVQGAFRFPSGTARASNGPETTVRFDSAWYLPAKQGSIFSRVTPWISYSTSDPAVNQSAHHIQDAQQHPESTYPKVDGKHIPGASAGDPLHRLYFDTTRRRQNRETFAVPVCQQQWPGYPELSQDCDEYPFASTYEGAARHLYQNVPYGWFSVRPILFSDNQTAGQRLGTWYGADRILDGDAFYVRITS